MKIILVLLFCSQSICCQYQRKIDSLHNLYQIHKNKDLQRAEKYARESVFLSDKNNQDSLATISHFYLAENLYKQRQIKETEKNITTTLKLAKRLNNEQYKALSYLMLAKINRVNGNYDLSLINLNKTLSIAKKNNLYNLEHKTLISKAILFKRTKNAKKSKRVLNQILKNNRFKDTILLSSTYNALGSLYFKSFHLKDSSALFLKKGIELINHTDNDYSKTVLYYNYGDLLLQNKKEKEALYYLMLTEKIAKKNNNFKSLFYVNNALAIYHHGNNNYKKAIEKYTEAFEKYGSFVKNPQIAHLYWLLADALYLNKQPDEAYLYLEKLIYLKDSLFTTEKNKTFEKLQTEYEVAKKNDQIAFLEKEQILEAKQKKLIIGVGGLLLIALILLVFIYRYRVKSQKIIRSQEKELYAKEKTELEQAQKIERIEGYIAGEEKEKNRIAIELHDGIGGQLSGIKHFVSSLPKNNETAVLQKNISTVSKEVRLLSHTLSSNYSLQQSFKNLLKTLQHQYENHFTIEVSLFPEEAIENIANEQKLFLYRTIQELINNTYKYAKANLVTISITISDEIVLILEDNGIGFETKNTFNGIGLENIKERVSTLKGTFVLDSVLERGTSIIIEIPNTHA